MFTQYVIIETYNGIRKIIKIGEEYKFKKYGKIRAKKKLQYNKWYTTDYKMIDLSEHNRKPGVLYPVEEKCDLYENVSDNQDSNCSNILKSESEKEEKASSGTLQSVMNSSLNSHNFASTSNEIKLENSHIIVKDPSDNKPKKDKEFVYNSICGSENCKNNHSHSISMSGIISRDSPFSEDSFIKCSQDIQEFTPYKNAHSTNIYENNLSDFDKDLFVNSAGFKTDSTCNTDISKNATPKNVKPKNIRTIKKYALKKQRKKLQVFRILDITPYSLFETFKMKCDKDINYITLPCLSYMCLFTLNAQNILIFDEIKGLLVYTLAYSYKKKVYVAVNHDLNTVDAVKYLCSGFNDVTIVKSKDLIQIFNPQDIPVNQDTPQNRISREEEIDIVKSETVSNGKYSFSANFNDHPKSSKKTKFDLQDILNGDLLEAKDANKVHIDYVDSRIPCDGKYSIALHQNEHPTFCKESEIHSLSGRNIDQVAKNFDHGDDQPHFESNELQSDQLSQISDEIYVDLTDEAQSRSNLELFSGEPIINSSIKNIKKRKFQKLVQIDKDVYFDTVFFAVKSNTIAKIESHINYIHNRIVIYECYLEHASRTYSYLKNNTQFIDVFMCDFMFREWNVVNNIRPKMDNELRSGYIITAIKIRC